MNVRDFPTSYKLKMIRAYPVIAQMDADEEYLATPAERDEAFARILDNRHLRRTHEMFLAELALPDGEELNFDEAGNWIRPQFDPATHLMPSTGVPGNQSR